MKIVKICDWLISFSFSALFFLTPLILTPWNYELFEYNKMMLIYALTIIITGSWLIKMVVHKKFLFQRTPFDLPIALFFVSQFFSFLFSMDRHVSLFGYYSRFNGGLLSTITYIALYYAFVTNVPKEKINKLLFWVLSSGFIVAVYGILEHLGIDKNLWVQDVQNRVFSTLGQPNWLGAYLAILIPIAIGILTMDNRKWKIGVEDGKSKIVRKNLSSSFHSQPLSSIFHHLSSKTTLFFYFLLSTFYLCLLYTKSRSGFLGFGVAFLVFVILTVMLKFFQHPHWQNFFHPLFLLSTFYFILSTLIGTPWTPSIANFKFQISNFKFGRQTVMPPTPPTGPVLEAGGTESGEIRKIVWSGAIDIARHYPLFGTGPETFAFSYYKFRPVSHNLVSEWDFLYNKAHNEYLNYAATTGFVGLGTYLLFIGWFIVWSLRKIFNLQFTIFNQIPISQFSKLKHLDIKNSFQISNFKFQILFLALFSAWLSILITNFFGFAVVIISLYFWLIPAMMYVVAHDRELQNTPYTSTKKISLHIARLGFNLPNALICLILLATFYLLLTIIRFWYADVRFNRAYQLSRAGYYQQAYQPFHEAIDANPQEPFYRDELSFTNAMLSVTASQQKESTLSAQLAREAILENQKALRISPQNVNFYKTQTKVYYTLSALDPHSNLYNQKALESLKIAKTLAPTDPKITYNLALLYSRLGKNQEAIKTLKEAILLKTNYQDARYALALFYHEAGKKKEAIAQLEYILKYISPTDKQIQEKLKEWQP